jgi:hypothetical protein
VSEPNQLTAPGERAARARVEALFERIDEIGPAIRFLPVPRLDLVAREALLADVEGLADRNGRGALLDEARERLRDGLLRLAGTRLQPGWIGQPIASTGTIEDQIARQMAIEDAVTVAVVEDLLDDDTIGALSSPGKRMLGMPLPGFDGDRMADGADDTAGREPSGDVTTAGEAALDDAAPDDDDRAAAEAQVEAIEQEAALRQRRAVVFVAAMAIVLPLGVAGGVSLPILVVIAIAALFLAWVFA